MGRDFIDVFRTGGETFVSLVVGIIPLLIVLLTAVHALIKLIGPEKIDRVGEMAGRPACATTRSATWSCRAGRVLPDQPDGYTMGRFLPERDKPAFYDSAVSFVHPRSGCSPTSTPASCSSGPASRPGSPPSACPSATWPSATSTSA